MTNKTTVPARFSAATTRALIAEGIEDYEQGKIDKENEIAEWIDNANYLAYLYSELRNENKHLDILAEDIYYAELAGFFCKIEMKAYDRTCEYIEEIEDEIERIERLI